MVETPHDDVREISSEPLDASTASFLRTITTFLGFHRACRFKVCRRANACATRHVVCYQAMEEDMNPIVVSILARKWSRAVERGEEIDVAPGTRDDMLRRLAWEDEEIARIESGALGGDDALTPYQLWLKNYAALDSRRPSRRAVAAPGGDGQPYDPDARVPS